MAHSLPEAVKNWFNCWNSGDIDALPITDDFSHRSPFGEISPKSRYMEIVNQNRDQFLGNRLTVLKAIVDGANVCVQFRQTRDDDPDFEMKVCEWYQLRDGKIQAIESFYNIGNAVIQG